MIPWADPRIWIIGALLLALGIGAAVEEIRIAALRGEVEQAHAEGIAQREAVAALKVQLAAVESNRDRLELTIAGQNASIAALKSAAGAAESAASLRALRVLEAGKAAARAADAGVGDAALNGWLRMEFAP